MASSNTLPEGTDSIIEGAGVLGEDEGGLPEARIGEDALTGGVAGNAGTGAADATPGSYGRSGTGGDAAGAGDPGSSGSGLAKDRPFERDTSSASDAGSGEPQSLRQQATDRVQDLRGQATDRAREWAEQGKGRATDALDNVHRMISDAAAQVDDKVGSEYGDYARRAADLVDSLSTTLRDKDVDALVADTRDLVRRSPGLAATAAAVVGFALVRVVKAGLEAEQRSAARNATGKAA